MSPRHSAEPGEPRLTRRQEYALATRQAITQAARELYTTQGFFATTVDEIADRARVAPATVYAVGGGKRGLLNEIVTSWLTDPIVDQTLADVSSQENPARIIETVAAVSRQMREQFADVMQILLTTAPHDPEINTQLQEATSTYRASFAPVADRLREIGALRSDLDIADAVDLLWFYFGYSSYFTLHDDNNWSYDRAEAWLAKQAIRELTLSDRS